MDGRFGWSLHVWMWMTTDSLRSSLKNSERPVNSRKMSLFFRVVCHVLNCVTMGRKFFARPFPGVQKVVRAMPKRRSAAQIMINKSIARSKLQAKRIAANRDAARARLRATALRNALILKNRNAARGRLSKSIALRNRVAAYVARQPKGKRRSYTVYPGGRAY